MILTWLCVEPAGVEEVGGEVDVHVTEEEQHVASLPGPGPDVQTPTPGELLVQLQQGVVLEVPLPAETQTVTHGVIYLFHSSLVDRKEDAQCVRHHFMADYKDFSNSF